MKTFRTMLIVSVCAVLYGLPAAAGDEVPRMSGAELKGRLGDADLVVVDVRAAGAWDASDARVQGAVREDPSNVEAWIGKYPKDRTLVFYCA